MNPATAAVTTARQHTLRKAAEVRGVGVHTGAQVTLRLEPAPEGAGVVFVRTDLPGRPEIAVRPEAARIEDSRRMTVLESADGAARVGMIEHLLAACAGLGVHNLRVELDHFECPIFDGSARPYVEMMLGAGLERQTAPAPSLRLRRPVILRRGGAQIVALPAQRARFTFFAEFRDHGLPDEQVTFEPASGDFAAEIAPARTFCFWEEIEALREAGLIQGGSLDCAIVLRDGQPWRSTFRLKNELAKHKLLDLMGDLAVLGAPVLALISARASGHALHQEFAGLLAEEVLHD